MWWHRVSSPTLNADESARRRVKVSGRGIFKRVTRAGADELIARGWARWVEYGHVELTEDAPISMLSGSGRKKALYEPT